MPQAPVAIDVPGKRALILFADDQPARGVRRVPPEPVADARIEAHHRVRPAIAFEHPPHREAQRRRALLALRLDLDQQRHPAAHEIEQFAQSGDAIAAAGEHDLAERCRGARRQFAVLGRQPVELPVVEHHRGAVAAFLHIAFDAEPPGDRRRRGGERVFRHPAAVQSAMRELRAAQPGDPHRPGSRSE